MWKGDRFDNLVFKKSKSSTICLVGACIVHGIELYSLTVFSEERMQVPAVGTEVVKIVFVAQAKLI